MNYIETAKSTTYLAFEQNKVKFGFTLAEVLITLGIIGVVAAMTIPMLIENYQKKSTVVRLQKAISVLNQAYKLSFDDVGEPENAFELGSEAYFKQYWAPYIKALTYCKTPKECGYSSGQPFKFVNGHKDGTALIANGYRTTFYTADNFLYIIFTGGNNAGTWVASQNVIVDINGGDGPNRWGRDVFWLLRLPDGEGVQPNGYDKNASSVQHNCLENAQAAYCAEKIRRSGWQIEKDYPWK